MPYTKFRVIDENPPPDNPNHPTDEWAKLKTPEGTVEVSQLQGAAGHHVAQADGTWARVCEADVSMMPGTSYQAWIQHNPEVGSPTPGQWVQYSWTMPQAGVPAGNDSVILRAHGNSATIEDGTGGVFPVSIDIVENTNPQ